MPREDDVRAAGEAADVEAEAQTVAMERRADEALWSGVMAADGGHDARAGGGGGARSLPGSGRCHLLPSESAREMAQYGRITERTH